MGSSRRRRLRNVAKTAPYMHDGVYQTLWDVVNHYNFGGSTGPYSGSKDPALAPLLLTDAELGDLVEFLRALDDGEPLNRRTTSISVEATRRALLEHADSCRPLARVCALSATSSGAFRGCGRPAGTPRRRRSGGGSAPDRRSRS